MLFLLPTILCFYRIEVQNRRLAQDVSHGLYHLRPSTHVGAVMESPSLLHAQLGHPSLSKLQQFVLALFKLSHLVYESCQLGKHSRTSFSHSVIRGTSCPFALVDSDIWGPSHVKSTLGFQYFVTFIDDYSRCTSITKLNV